MGEHKSPSKKLTARVPLTLGERLLISKSMQTTKTQHWKDVDSLSRLWRALDLDAAHGLGKVAADGQHVEFTTADLRAPAKRFELDREHLDRLIALGVPETFGEASALRPLVERFEKARKDLE